MLRMHQETFYQKQAMYSVRTYIHHDLQKQVYQDLLDRGWRRSGTWLYLPIYDKTCCPCYTHRLDVSKFAPNKVVPCSSFSHRTQSISSLQYSIPAKCQAQARLILFNALTVSEASFCMQTQTRAVRRFDAYLRGSEGAKDAVAQQKADNASCPDKSGSAEKISRNAKRKQSERIEHSESIVRALQKAAEVLCNLEAVIQRYWILHLYFAQIIVPISAKTGPILTLQSSYSCNSSIGLYPTDKQMIQSRLNKRHG